MEHNPPILKHLTRRIDHDSSRQRYTIAKKSLLNFIKICWAGMFANVLDRMEHTWYYIRWPKSEEILWFLMLFGKKGAKHILNGMLKKRHELNKKSVKERHEFIDDTHRIIREYDANIISWYKEAVDNKYDILQTTYSFITDPLLEICYPNFIKTLHNNNEI